ncbi:Calcineurin-like phosphoesterase domain, ApaH type [Candidatus Nanopelagicaceae bacterium]
MSNPFSYFSRRNFLKASVLGVAAASPLSRAIAAIPVTAKLVGTPAPTSFTVAISASVKVNAYIEYGYSKSALSGKTPSVTITQGTTSNLTISGLKPNSQIFYKVKYAVGLSKNFASLAQRAVTTRSANSNAVFAIQADPHMDENSSAEVYKGTLKQIVAASPAFLMDLGDIFMVDKLQDKSEANIRGRFELMKGYYAELGSVPLKICLGNHDGELGYSKFNTKSYRKEYFPEQTGELAYYSFTGPDQLHIVLDPFTYTTKNPSAEGWEWTLGKPQYEWLVSTLKNSQERHKFIYIHHLLVGDQTSRGGVEIAKLNEWGGNNKDGTYGFDTYRPGWGKPIHQLLLDYKVGFVFKGHDHLYVKQELDGVIYQTLPQPSHPGEKIDVKQYGYISGKGVGGSGFLKVSTSAGTAQVDFITFDGKIADTYTRMASQ